MAFELDLTCIKIKWYTKFQINMSKHVGEKCGKLWRTDGRTETRTDGHHHTIIRPVWRRAYKNQQGGDYMPNTLYEIAAAIQHHIRQTGRFVSFFDDQCFEKMRKVLDAKMKELSKRGLGLEKKKADVISTEQEEIMWQNGILGTDTPQKLLDTLVYSLGLNFALRAGQEHRNLRVGALSQIKVVTDEHGTQYLEYREDVSKTNRGGLKHRKMDPKVTRAYANSANPGRCPIKIYEKYISLRWVISYLDVSSSKQQSI